MNDLRQVALTICCAVVLAALPRGVNAQSNVCVDLEAQLIALERNIGTGSRQTFREYDASVRQQQREIDRASAEARRSRCVGSFLFSKRQAAPKCAELMSTIERMKANQRRLVAARNRYTTDPSSISRQRSQILHAMSVNRCRTVQARIRSAPSGGLFANLFGQGRTRSFGDDLFFRGSGGTYRTLCVRTCDGYFFPISFSTVQGQFAADDATCRSMCPGTEVALFTHRNPGEESAAMVSLAGQPYTSLPAAFKYREEFNPTCGCGSPAVTTVASLEPAFDLSRQQRVQPFVAVPATRPTRYEDPETLANRAGGFVVRSPRQASGTVVAELPASNGIRIVGPSFFYGEQTNIEALTPKRKPDLRSTEDEPGEGAAGP